MPKQNNNKHQLLTLLTLSLTTASTHAERMACLCCDEYHKLIEITVKKCTEVPAHHAVKGIEYKGAYDLAIQATMTSRVPYSRFDGIDYEAYETDLNIEQYFVYEEHNKTCEDFQAGQQKLMQYEELRCVLLNDKDFSNDPACFYGGHKVSDLPFEVKQALKEQ